MNRYDIFISYRREGGYDTAKHLYDLLARDGYRVSFDIDTLTRGDFDISLLKRIDECKDFILIVDQHAFDRTLDLRFNPKKDWMRQELAHALKKRKNIIPVFLNGVSKFPENLPDDIRGVVKKNGPQYNRYYFNDFYKRIKSDFLTARPRKRTAQISIIAAIVLMLALSFSGWLIFNGRNDSSTHTDTDDLNTSEFYEKITPDMSATEAKELFINVAGRTPIYAAAYSEDEQVLVGLVNNDVPEGEQPDSKFVAYPDLTLMRYHNEDGVWQQDLSKKIVFDRIIDLDDASPFCFFDDGYELYSASQQPYLFFHLERSCMGTASEDIYHDFVVINLAKASYHFLEYMENKDSHYTENGTLYKESKYPKGIEELLVMKFNNTDEIETVSNK